MPTLTRPATTPAAVPDALRVLIALSHHRWSLPVLAYMQRKGGARVIELVQSLRLHRDTLRITLAALTAGGWVRENQGYGHALRPELVLTRTGETIGPAVRDLMESITGFGREEPLLRKWALPVLWLLGEGRARFNELKAHLPGITPRALTTIVKELVEARLVSRRVEDGYPPMVTYGLSATGSQVVSRLRGLMESIERA